MLKQSAENREKFCTLNLLTFTLSLTDFRTQKLREMIANIRYYGTTSHNLVRIVNKNIIDKSELWLVKGFSLNGYNTLLAN